MTEALPTRIPILIYHSLAAEAAEPYRPYSMDPGRFAEHMEHIAAGGYETLTVGQLSAALAGHNGSVPERPLVITFDDGFEDTYSVALPILTKLGLRSTVYVVTGQIGGKSRWLAPQGEGERPMLSAGQVRDLDAAGVDIGSHGHWHVALDEIPFAEAVREIDTSRATLEEIVGHRVVTFAYPYGYHTGRIKRYLETTGFESACAVKQALSHPNDDRFALARAIVNSDATIEVLDSWIRGEGLPMSWRGERPQTTLWRYVRRMKRAVSRPNEGDIHG
ncbi:MAG TPA: polysaccharide deacetylase family protein [Candidatus Limnocylindrales bacterium]